MGKRHSHHRQNRTGREETIRPKSLAKLTYAEVSLLGDRSPSLEQKAFDFFLSHNISPANIVSYEQKGKLVTGFYTRSLKKAARLKAAFLSLKRSGLRFRLRLLDRRDWLDKWNAYFHVKSFGTRFVVVPLWEKSKFKPGKRLPVYLDPLGAFGTGCHETTRLMERLMEKLHHRFADFFDIGTGTGILSIAACLLGAQRVVAIDTHGPSVQAARFNLRQNQCRGTVLKADITTFRAGSFFDLVAANLLSGLLVEQKRKIIFSVRKGKYLLVSGIGLEHLTAFRRDFASRHLKCLKVSKGRKWAALLYRRVV